MLSLFNTLILDSMTVELEKKFIENEEVKEIWDETQISFKKELWIQDSSIGDPSNPATTMRKKILAYENELSSI